MRRWQKLLQACERRRRAMRVTNRDFDGVGYLARHNAFERACRVSYVLRGV